jgi:pyruvate dehydrogenase E1 component alpha subunit
MIARTYRWSGHTSADAGAYRNPDEVARAKADDPLARTRAQLAELGVATREMDGAVAAAEGELAEAIAAAERAPPPALHEALAEVQDIGAPAFAGAGARA